MNKSTESQRPQPIAGIDIRKLPIGPGEAFVFSRVDGATTVREIGYATSLPEGQVLEHLRRLRSLGAIAFDEPSPTSGQVARQPQPAEQAQTNPNSPIPTAKLADATELDNPAPNDSESNPATDLDVRSKREILDLYSRLDTLDHFQILGIAEDTDRRAVKAAYYERVKTFHPDRYFGKNLGPFRAKLEHCFARLTEAHDTLTTASRRSEYQTYLSEQRQALELERAMSQVVTASDLDMLEQRIGSALSSQAKANILVESGAAVGSSTAVGQSATSTVIEFSEAQPSVPPPRMSDDERRRFLARKLRVSSASLQAPPRTSSPAPTPPPASREQIASQLRQQLGATRRDEAHRQLETHLAAADAAIAAKDPVGAANALRLAQSLAPKDPNIAERLSEAQALAATALSDTYLRQAEYEEKSGRYDTAARSYERAARGKPAASTWEAAARCVLEASGDLRVASEFARMAIGLEPERAASHLLLGRVFLAARMKSSAIAELERARRLDPNNDTVLNLLKRIANDEI